MAQPVPTRPAHARLAEVTERIARRSYDGRARYLERIAKAGSASPRRQHLGCANQAHGFAACGTGDKAMLRDGQGANLAIITAYNDMLSAHQPYETYPELIRAAARQAGSVAQVAGGVPAMCDGITQGEAGMDLSLFSREVIALSTAVALSHQTFDAAVYLGICDKIVPGLVIGALAFGHLPAVFVPAGPMPSGLPNDEKARIRQLFAEGKVGRAELLEAESASYHGPGTCTFYGTANTNQMMMEIMGLHLPGASFVNPNTPLREALTTEAARRALSITALGNHYTPLGPHARRARLRQRHRRTARHGRLDQPYFAHRGHGGGSRPAPHLDGFLGPGRGRAAADPRLSERQGRCEPFPRGRRHERGDPRAARRGAAACRCHDRVRRGPRGLHQRARVVGGRPPILARGAANERRRSGAARRPGAVPPHRRAESARRRSRPRHHQDLGDRGRAPRDRGTGPHLPLAGGVPGGLQGGPVEGRPRGRRAVPGSQGQRHARTAQADVAARGSAGPGPEGGARHRRPAVGAPRARSRPPSM